MPIRFAHAGDFYLDEHRYFANTAQCLEWFVADAIRANVDALYGDHNHNEAVNLGIASYNMRQGEGIRYETLFRDETVGALDAVKGKEYVRMLRRAVDLGGFHQVMFICHSPMVWELVDDIISVGGGCLVMDDREAAVTTESPKPTRPSDKGLTANDPGSGHLLEL